ncbi:MAG: beta-ketoacyl-ACP synthase III [Bacillota bacterium]|nr:beta-ketoacyl-ACP synthase III [Bacillota bacterium]
MNYNSTITGWGKYVPRQVLTNDSISKFVDTSDKWISGRTGIKQRHIAEEDETIVTMAVEASKKALEVADLKPEQLDMIILVTSEAGSNVPSVASRIQGSLNAKNAAAFDVLAACSGFIVGLSTADAFIKSGTYESVLVVAAEKLSHIVDWTDRNTCILFGDGAGAVVVERSEEPGILGSKLHCDGSFSDVLYLPNSREAVGNGKLGSKMNTDSFLKMKGHELFVIAVQAGVDVIREISELYNVSFEDVDLIIAHQANVKILAEISNMLELSEDKVFTVLSKYGNIAAASIPLTLCEALENGKIKKGDTIIFTGFGAGLTWGANIIKWNPRK